MRPVAPTTPHGITPQETNTSQLQRNLSVLPGFRQRNRRRIPPIRGHRSRGLSAKISSFHPGVRRELRFDTAVHNVFSRELCQNRHIYGGATCYALLPLHRAAASEQNRRRPLRRASRCSRSSMEARAAASAGVGLSALFLFFWGDEG